MSVELDGETFDITDFIGDDGLGYVQLRDVDGSIPQEVLFPNRLFRRMLNELNTRAGAAGAGSLGARMTLDLASTAASDPGTGKVRFNAAIASATAMYIDLADVDGADITNILAAASASTSTVKSYIGFRKLTDASAWAIASISAMASPAGYRNFTITYIASGTTALVDTDSIVFSIIRNGDKGDTGAVSVPQADETTIGGGEIATLIEAIVGTSITTLLNPLKLASLIALSGWIVPAAVVPKGVALTTTLTTSLLPAVAAGTKILVHSIQVANIDGTNSADATFGWFDNSAGATYKLAHTVAVAADSSKGMGAGRPILVLEESDQLRGGASANGDLVAIIHYSVVASTVGWLSIGAALTNTTTTDIVGAVPSAKKRHVFNIQVANTDGTTACDVTVGLMDSSDSSTLWSLAFTATVAADEAKSMLVVNPGLVMETGDKIQAGKAASPAGTADIIVTYLELDAA